MPEAPDTEVSASDVAELLSRWWFAYDHGDYATLRTLLHDKAHFTSRSDSGDAPWEAHVSCDLTGAEEVAGWQRRHREVSPTPMRHFATNAHITGRAEGEASFASYMFVTKTVGGAPRSLSSGVVTGSVVAGEYHPVFLSLSVVIDFMESK
jgi:hypothetical protein